MAILKQAVWDRRRKCLGGKINFKKIEEFSRKIVVLLFCSRKITLKCAKHRINRVARVPGQGKYKIMQTKTLLATLTDSFVRTSKSKYLPKRNRMVAICVLACTDKERVHEPNPRGGTSATPQCSNTKKLAKGRKVRSSFVVYNSTASRRRLRSEDKSHS